MFTAETSCSACDAGYACVVGGAVQSNPPSDICRTGYYCPDGITIEPCAAGRYGTGLGKTASSDCDTCPVGEKLFMGREGVSCLFGMLFRNVYYVINILILLSINSPGY